MDQRPAHGEIMNTPLEKRKILVHACVLKLKILSPAATPPKIPAFFSIAYYLFLNALPRVQGPWDLKQGISVSFICAIPRIKKYAQASFMASVSGVDGNVGCGLVLLVRRAVYYPWLERAKNSSAKRSRSNLASRLFP